MRSIPSNLQGVLFDLDGTLLDSAPDLYTALVAQCSEQSVQAPPYAPVRQVVSRGARAVLRCAFAEQDDAALDLLLPRYLEIYQELMGEQTSTFEGVDELLALIEASDLRWGIVTNKAGYLTDELLVRIGWAGRAHAVVCGDTLPVKKPDPAPVLLACQRADIDPVRSLFVGDDRRDIQAGAAAGLHTVAVSWGYLDGSDPYSWNADTVLDTPAQLTALLAQVNPVT